MPRIGETLREARMRRQVDIGEVENATKIRAKYLRALENEEFDLLPGPTFVRSFLKTYAEYLGLDARMLVEEFRADYEGFPEEEPTPAFANRAPQGRRREPTRYDRRPIGAGWVVGGVAAALLVLFLILGLTGGDGGSPRNGTNGAQQSADRGERDPAAERRRQAAEQKRRQRARSVTLKVNPLEPTYVCVDRGAGQPTLFEGSLVSARTFRGKRLRINLGRPSARVRVNGRPVQLGSRTQSVGLAFTPGKRPRSLPLGQRPCA